MQKLLSSATRISLLLLMGTLAVAAILIVFVNRHTDSIITGVLGLFSNVTIAIVSFYFGQKTSPSGDGITSTN